MTASDQSADLAYARCLALDALARREHSRYELSRKLTGKLGCDAVLVDPVLDRLEEDGLLSDWRFAEAFVSARVRRGQGPLRIRAELRERRVAEDSIEAVLAAAEMDWVALAVEVLRKKFGKNTGADYRDRARRMRFLQYRGFTGEQIRGSLGED